MEKDSKIDISKQIDERIRNEHVKIRSKWIFVAERLGLESGLLLSIILGIIIICFILYVMEQNGVFEFTEFGMRGWPVIFDNIPYDLVIVGIIFFVLVNYIIMKFDFSYRKPFYLLSCGVLVFISISGAILMWTGISHALFDKIAGTSIIKNFTQKKITNSPQGENAIIGKVVKIGSKTVLIQTPRGAMINININPIERPLDVVFIPGQAVKIIGKKEGELFKAKLIRIIRNDAKYFRLAPSATNSN